MSSTLSDAVEGPAEHTTGSKICNVRFNEGVDKDHILRQPMEISANRLNTYKNSNWDEFENTKRPPSNKMSEAGFFYTGIKDEVKCFSCELVMQDWKTNDKPQTEHENQREECPYVKSGFNMPPQSGLLAQSYTESGHPVVAEEETHSEGYFTLSGSEIRLSTAQWSYDRDQATTAKLLSATGARASSGLTVTCRVCGFQVDYTDGVDVLGEHRRHNPKCHNN